MPQILFCLLLGLFHEENTLKIQRMFCPVSSFSYEILVLPLITRWAWYLFHWWKDSSHTGHCLDSFYLMWSYHPQGVYKLGLDSWHWYRTTIMLLECTAKLSLIPQVILLSFVFIHIESMYIKKNSIIFLSSIFCLVHSDIIQLEVMFLLGQLKKKKWCHF